jgi:hypothetical protein
MDLFWRDRELNAADASVQAPAIHQLLAYGIREHLFDLYVKLRWL